MKVFMMNNFIVFFTVIASCLFFNPTHLQSLDDDYGGHSREWGQDPW